ncbi:MAG: hypothetical protein ABIL06_16100 [Pseudomonadota bacterium]
MSILPSLCIDPHLLSLPRMERSTKDDIEDFVSSIIDWGKTIGVNCTKPFVSSTVLDAIEEDGAFPWRKTLDGILKHFKVQAADSKTVSDVVQSLINCSRIEDAVGLKALLLEAKKTEIAPAFVCERLRSKTRSAFSDMLAMIVMARHGYGRDVENVSLASIPNDNAKPKLQYLLYSAEIVDVEWKNDSDDRDIKFPYAINDHVSVFFSRDGLLESVEPLSLWPATNDSDAACNAIDCCITRLVAAGTSEKNKIPYSVGANFLATAQNWECGHEGSHAFTLIESCARIVLNIPKHEVKPFYDRASRRHRDRGDGALAFRTHLTKRGAGLRLMLWKMSSGTIEFANVSDKDELIIL